MTPTMRETDGIVLDSRDHGESDLIITLYCRDAGRVTAIAKGAKKSLRRFVNKLELFSYLHVTLRQRNSNTLALLEEAELHSGFIQLRQDLCRYTAASVLREFMLLATREGEADERCYTLLLWSLHRLDQSFPHLQVVMLFLIRFFDYIGYRPQLRSCFYCGTATAEIDANFSFSTACAGLVCTSCAAAGSQSGIRLSPATIAILQSCQDTPLERLHRLKISDSNLYEALNVLHRYGRHLLGRDIISWAILRRTLQSSRIVWANHR